MNAEDFRLLYDYNSWANHRMLDACAALGPEQFTRDMGSSYRSVRDTLVHLMLVEWLWLEDVQRVVHHNTTAGVPQAAPLWQMLQHALNHSTYHRGQVTTLFRQLGAKATGTDLIMF